MTAFEILSDAVVVALCAAAAVGCFVLNRRVRRLASTELGIGKAVSEMAESVARFETLLGAAEESTREASSILDEQLAQARKLVARLEAIAGAATRPSAPAPAPSGKRADPRDPLADVVPKGVGERPASPSAGAPGGAALSRLAELALQRRGTSSAGAARAGRRASA